MLRFVFSAWVCVMFSACSTTPLSPQAAKPIVTHERSWQGRISVMVHSEPPRVNTASFSLQGDPQAGELQFYSPMGTTLALLQWQGSSVHLHRGQAPEIYASMDDLTEQLTGSALPISALFDWLDGKPHPVSGWQAQLPAANANTLMAYRSQPQPTVTLRIQLEP